MMKKDILLPATLKAVSQFNIELENVLASVPYDVRVSIVLAVQELCVNIVRHAYAGTPGEIQLQIDLTPQQLTISCFDKGANHLTLPETISMPDPLDLPESGMGLFIIYQTFDKVDYEALPDGNRWQLLKVMES
jgi:serine/threonine-protein kinase RsbW